MVLLLDAANTLISKPSFFSKFREVLETHGYPVDDKHFRYHHKLISEVIIFPDKTSQSFYESFNAELLYSLGIIPTKALLENLFNACSYLPWEKFDDTNALHNWNGTLSVLSNFHKGLTGMLEDFFPGMFGAITISENTQYRKPQVEFYLEAVKALGVPPQKIIYIGDSPKLDLEPALAAGMNAWVIDRDDFFPACTRRILSLHQIFEKIGE